MKIRNRLSSWLYRPSERTFARRTVNRLARRLYKANPNAYVLTGRDGEMLGRFPSMAAAIDRVDPDRTLAWIQGGSNFIGANDGNGSRAYVVRAA